MVLMSMGLRVEERLEASGCGGKEPGMGARRAADGVVVVVVVGNPDELVVWVGIIVVLDDVDDAAESVPARSGG